MEKLNQVCDEITKILLDNKRNDLTNVLIATEIKDWSVLGSITTIHFSESGIKYVETINSDFALIQVSLNKYNRPLIILYTKFPKR